MHVWLFPCFRASFGGLFVSRSTNELDDATKQFAIVSDDNGGVVRFKGSVIADDGMLFFVACFGGVKSIFLRVLLNVTSFYANPFVT